jgi:hypothetical protein
MPKLFISTISGFFLILAALLIFLLPNTTQIYQGFYQEDVSTPQAYLPFIWVLSAGGMPTVTPPPTGTTSPSETNTPGIPTSTSSLTLSITPPPSITTTSTPKQTHTSTPTLPTRTQTPTVEGTPTSTVTHTPTVEGTPTCTNTFTPTGTDTPTVTGTLTPSPSLTPTPTSTSSSLIWYYQVLDTYVIDTAPSLDIDSGGRPAIAYARSINNDIIYTRFNGSEWVYTLIPYGSYNANYVETMKLDSGDRPHISVFSYWGRSSGNMMWYAYWDKINWYIMDVAPNSGWLSSLALDSSNLPHIASNNGGIQNLEYYSYDGSSWQIEIIEPCSYGFQASLAIDSDGKPHIAYVCHGSLRYARFDGISWVITEVKSGNFQWISIALDSGNSPLIAFTEVYYPIYTIGLATYSGSSWQTENIAQGVMPSLAIDSNDHPGISFYDPDNNKLFFLYDDGNVWQQYEVYEDPTWLYASLCFDQMDQPHIAFARDINGDAELIYASTNNQPLPTDTPTPLISLTPTPSKTRLPTQTPTETNTETPFHTKTPTRTTTYTPVPTSTLEPSSTQTRTATSTTTPTPTNTHTETTTITLTSTPTETETLVRKYMDQKSQSGTPRSWFGKLVSTINQAIRESW